MRPLTVVAVAVCLAVGAVVVAVQTAGAIIAAIEQAADL